MNIISHRGNINGKIPEKENNPSYIDEAIRQGYYVEVDIWYLNAKFWLGHDEPNYEVDFKWLLKRRKNLWVHCKNIAALTKIKSKNKKINYFWHENDKMTLTSNGSIWAFPGTQPIENSIAVLPEINNDNTSYCMGVCTDYPKKYKNEKK